LSDLISTCTDLNLLMQILAYYVQQQVEEDAIDLVTGAICELAFVIKTKHHPDADSSFDEELVLDVCVRLLCADRQDLVKRILTAFDGLREVVKAVSEILRLSPWSFEGMLLACEKLRLAKEPLQLDEWPHSVLLTEAAKVTDYEHLARIMRAVQKLVDDVEVIECYRAVLAHLTPPVLHVILETVLDNHSQESNDLKTAIILSNVVPVLAERANLVKAGFSPSELAARASDLLEKYKAESERYWCVYAWAYGELNGLGMSPLLAYSLGMSVLTNACASAGLPEEARQARTKATEALYEELRKVERWGGSGSLDFERVLCVIVGELGDQDLVGRVAQLFRSWNWQ